jgi:hypothetical protein
VEPQSDRGFKRVAILSDTHCGHLAGLTPPEYQIELTKDDQRRNKLALIQTELWNEFTRIVAENQPYDITVFNGDAIEGKGTKTGGTELGSSDRKVQTDMAARVIETVGAPVVRMTYGTPYHVGNEEDWEDIVAEKVGAKIGSHEWLEINGVILDVKHRVSSSVIPHGRLTALAREVLWNRLWHSRGLQPKADILIRSHVHYYEEMVHDGCRAVTTPSLQGMGSKFGARMCSGTVDFGLITLDVYKDGHYIWTPHFIIGQTQEAKAEVL